MSVKQGQINGNRHYNAIFTQLQVIIDNYGYICYIESRFLCNQIGAH